MNETLINRPIIWSAQRGIVTGQSVKRGRVMLTLKLDAGREVLCRATDVTLTDVDTWSKPTGVVTFGPKDRDYHGDFRRMMRR